MNANTWALVMLVAAGWAAGCSDQGASPICEPGEVQNCPCLGGSQGVQTCSADGKRWGDCACETPDGGADGDGEVDGDTEADGGDTDPGCAGGARASTVQEIAQGTVGEGVKARLTGVVVTSQLFLISKSANDECLWGVFVSAPGLATAEPYSGLLVASYGTPASIPPGDTRAYCPQLGVAPVGAALPDDLQPGEVLNLVGQTTRVLNTACATEPGGATVGQWELADLCLAERNGSAAIPAAAVVPVNDLARIASPSDSAFHDSWAGARIRLEAMTADVPQGAAACDGGGTSVVGDYGSITLASGGVEVGNRIYYRGYLKATQPCKDGPVFCTPDSSFAWDVIQGIHHLAYCTWGLQPNDKCADFTPPSADCAAASCAPY